MSFEVATTRCSHKMTFRDDLHPKADAFKTIGSLAAGTNDLPDDDAQRRREQEEGEGQEHPVQQIESLCMQCQQNVCPCPLS